MSCIVNAFSLTVLACVSLWFYLEFSFWTKSAFPWNFACISKTQFEIENAFSDFRASELSFHFQETRFQWNQMKTEFWCKYLKTRCQSQIAFSKYLQNSEKTPFSSKWAVSGSWCQQRKIFAAIMYTWKGLRKSSEKSGAPFPKLNKILHSNSDSIEFIIIRQVSAGQHMHLRTDMKSNLNVSAQQAMYFSQQHSHMNRSPSGGAGFANDQKNCHNTPQQQSQHSPHMTPQSNYAISLVIQTI